MTNSWCTYSYFTVNTDGMLKMLYSFIRNYYMSSVSLHGKMRLLLQELKECFSTR